MSADGSGAGSAGVPTESVDGAAPGTARIGSATTGTAAPSLRATPATATGGSGGEPTRYLCAAAQMDGGFATLLVNGILRSEHRSVASSPDVDLVAVLKHAVAGNTRRTLRNIAVFALFVLAIILAAVFGSILVLIVFYLIAAMVVTGEALHLRHEVLAGTLSREAFRPSEAPEPPSSLVPALRRIGAHGTGNVTVYSGYSPFVGYGSMLDSWSFALDIDKPAEGGGQVRGFTAEEIHDHVAARLGDLALPGLEISDRLFVNGRDIREDTRFLPDPTGRPVTAVGADLVRRLMVSPEDRARPYLTTRVVAWRGELALSVFCRFAVIESYLFAEASYSLLTPLRETYHAVDSVLPSPTVTEVFREAVRSVPAVPMMLVAGAVAVFHGMLSPLIDQMQKSRQRREIMRNPFYDYGSLFSVREAASDDDYQRYFQRLDSELHRKVIERRILDAMVGFLDDHGVSTADLVERRTTIMNYGVLVTGRGTLKAQSVAAGAGASAHAGGDSKKS